MRCIVGRASRNSFGEVAETSSSVEHFEPCDAELEETQALAAARLIKHYAKLIPAHVFGPTMPSGTNSRSR